MEKEVLKIEENKISEDLELDEIKNGGNAIVSILVFTLKIVILVTVVISLVIFYPILRSEFLNLAGVKENSLNNVTQENINFDESFFEDTTVEIVKINEAYNNLLTEFDERNETIDTLLERVSVLETEKKDLLEFLNENWEITQEENQEERNTTLDLSEGSSLEQFIQ